MVSLFQPLGNAIRVLGDPLLGRFVRLDAVADQQHHRAHFLGAPGNLLEEGGRFRRLGNQARVGYGVHVLGFTEDVHRVYQ